VAWAEASLRTKWHLDPSSLLATTDMGQKLGGYVSLGRGAGSLSNSMCPGPRPTLMPSFILIRPTVWLQCTNVTRHRQDIGRQDRQRSDSIGLTVLQTVAQKNDKHTTCSWLSPSGWTDRMMRSKKSLSTYDWVD